MMFQDNECTKPLCMRACSLSSSPCGAGGDTINGYFARPLGAGLFQGLVLIHHLPGWDEWYRDCARKFAHHGYAAISPNLYSPEGHGTLEDVGAI